MPKEFYTEKDIEDMVKRGILSLEINDNVVLTDLAYEKANRLGMHLVRDKPDNPPSAPVRPYIAQKKVRYLSESAPGAPVQSPLAAAEGAGPIPIPQADGEELQKRIRSAVIARMGNQVDANLLDVIIKRVLNSTGMK
jgi:hypothetical protein